MARHRYYNQYSGGETKQGDPAAFAWFLTRIVIPGIILGALAWVIISMWWNGKLGVLF